MTQQYLCREILGTVTHLSSQFFLGPKIVVSSKDDPFIVLATINTVEQLVHFTKPILPHNSKNHDIE